MTKTVKSKRPKPNKNGKPSGRPMDDPEEERERLQYLWIHSADNVPEHCICSYCGYPENKAYVNRCMNGYKSGSDADANEEQQQQQGEMKTESTDAKSKDDGKHPKLKRVSAILQAPVKWVRKASHTDPPPSEPSPPQSPESLGPPPGGPNYVSYTFRRAET